MSILNTITALAGNIIKPVGDLVDNLHTSQEEKDKVKAEIARIISARISETEATARAELMAKQAIIVAEMQQGDKFTKRARPMVVYCGLIMIFINYVLIPGIQSISGITINAPSLPGDFWLAWGSVVGIWSIGRSAERRGANNKLTNIITGENSPDLLK